LLEWYDSRVLRDFSAFLRAFWRQWLVLLTGGSVIAVIAIWNLAGRGAPPQQVNWLILGLTLVLAAFFSWREEWIRAGRDLVDIDFSEVRRITDGYTDIQSAQFLRKYVGKRYQVRAKIRNVSYSQLIGWNAFLYLDLEGITIAMMYFRWNPNISGMAVLPKGTEITVSGRVSEINFHSVFLRSCYVVAVHTAPSCEAVQPTPKPDP